MAHAGTFNRTLFMLIVAIALGLAAIWALSSAFAAANTVPNSTAGDGTSTISGYTVSAVDYTLNATNPANIDSVAFTLSVAPAAGSTIKIRLVSSGSDWYSCTNVTTAVTCTTTSPQATVTSANELRVVVAQ